MDDADFLLTLRNDPETRRQSLVTDEVDEAEHRAWLARALAPGSRCRIWIAMEGQYAMGTIRLDRKRGYEVVSLTVAPWHRRQDVGRWMLARLIALAQVQRLRLVAYVKTGNVVSKKIFETPGFGFVRAHVNDLKEPLYRYERGAR